MMVVNAFFYVSFRIKYGDFLGHVRNTKFRALGFNVGLRYRKSSFREETSRFRPVIKHLDVDFKGLNTQVGSWLSVDYVCTLEII